MKLIVAIIRDSDNDVVSKALTSANFRVTGIASTGGFLRKGQTTFLLGVNDTHVETALQIIRENVTKPSEADSRQTILFVLPVEQFIQY